MLTLATPTRQLMASLFAMGLASGLPLALTAGTLQAWYSDYPENSIQHIGLLSLVGLPYALKWLWSPLLDRLPPPWLDQRRGWIVLSQIALVLFITLMGHCSPKHHPLALAILAFGLAFFSASQDIAIDAYRTHMLETLTPHVGTGIALGTYGYRLAMLLSGGLTLSVADILGWRLAWDMLACIMALLLCCTLIAPACTYAPTRHHPLKMAIVAPIRQFMRRQHALIWLALILTYKHCLWPIYYSPFRALKMWC